MSVIGKADAPVLALGGGTGRRMGAYNPEAMLVEVLFETGSVGAEHTHEHTQISYCRSGEFVYVIEGVEYALHPGDSIVVDGGKKHGCRCVKAGSLLDFFTPMRQDFVK